MRLERGMFARDALLVAQNILGCYLVRRFDDGKVEKRIITEVEAYGGIEDKASHARFGKTKRNSVMWESPGLIYIYLVYGMHWMFNVVTGKIGEPQAVLVRSVDGIKGPGRVGRWLMLDKSFYGEDSVLSKRIWFEEGGGVCGKIIKFPRIGVDYAKEWAKKQWRFTLIFDER